MLAPVETTPKYQIWTDSPPTYSEKVSDNPRSKRYAQTDIYLLRDTITSQTYRSFPEDSSTQPSFIERQDLSHRVSFRNPEAVEAYLAQHPIVEVALYEAAPLLQEIFGASVRVVLEVLSYPEEGSYDELVGWIQSTDDVLAGLEKLEKFEEVWLPEHLDLSINTFNFNLETI